MKSFLSITSQPVFYDLSERFEPFLNKVSKLPQCKINVFEKADSANFVADSAFLQLVDSQFPKNATEINGFSFARCGDGVAVFRSGNSISWVHNNFQNIDACLYYDNPNLQVLNQIMMRAYSYTAVFNDALIIHSAAINYNGEGILFCGVPGAGKSTQSKLWQKVYNAEPINNDQPCVIFENGKAFVHGTPWSGKEPCYKNESYPIKAIVFVEKAPYEKVEKLSILEAYALLHLNNYLVPVVDGVEEKYSKVVEQLAKSVPVYKQYCTKTESAPRALRAVIDN